MRWAPCLVAACATLVVCAGAGPDPDSVGTEGGDEPQPSPTASPVAGTYSAGGYVRSYYFTRQNASNDPQTRFDFAPGAKYNANAVNQATWNTGIELHAAYSFPGAQWNAGVSYFYANPMDGPCVVAANHDAGAACVTQIPPKTNADDTLPGFTMSTLDEAYLAYKAYGFQATAGNQFFTSPWANPSDSRLKPAAFSGADVGYCGTAHWTFEIADMLEFENRTSSTFGAQTLLTSYPAGAKGMPPDIVVPSGQGIATSGFAYGSVRYENATPSISLAQYFYGIADLVDLWWFEGKYAMPQMPWKPFAELRGGFEENAGRSYLGRIDSRDVTMRVGAYPVKNLEITASANYLPWRTDTVRLPAGTTCDNTTYQIKATKTFGYFLPLDAAQCFTRASGVTEIYYGGWASPYTDSYGTDPFLTTSMTQGMADRRAPGLSWKIAATWSSNDKRLFFIATGARYDYGNGLAGEATAIWTIDARYDVVPWRKDPNRGLLIRYRYAQRTQSNTAQLGGLPSFKYNRAQFEYDF